MSDRDADHPGDSPEEWMREAFRRLFEGGDGFDPSELAKAAGFEGNPDELLGMIDQLTRGMGQAMMGGERAAVDHAVSVAKKDAEDVTGERAQHLQSLINIASLWVNEVTEIPAPDTLPLVMGRADWARSTLPVWQEMADPVATALSNALGDMMAEHAPEEMADLLGQSKAMLTKLGTSLFRLQLAGVVGTLSQEVLSAGDIGIPLIQAETEGDVRAGFLPQNMANFSQGLEVPADEVDLYVVVRELAHQRLFRHARWLRSHLMSVLGDYARGIRIDGDRIFEIAENLDPTKPEEIQELLANGALLPERTVEQVRALERLETMLALIEGWVDHITTLATKRLPKADSVAEAIRRRRATSGPAEQAFKTLVGLELRPRRLRDASALWARIFDACGSQARDELWSHPDVVPTEFDLDNPDACISRLTGSGADITDVDTFLDNIFVDDTGPSQAPPDEPEATPEGTPDSNDPDTPTG
jgi:putative hydrolase